MTTIAGAGNSIDAVQTYQQQLLHQARRIYSQTPLSDAT
jgi:hypothetical protein